MAWEKAKNIQKEGTYTGVVSRIRAIPGGRQFLVHFQPVDIDTERIRASVAGKPAEDARYSILLRDAEEKADEEGYKATVYFSGWKYIDEQTSDEEDIENLTNRIRVGHRITFRVSKNWRSSIFYIRYIKDEDLGIWSGYEKEADWRQETHNFPSIKEPGRKELTLMHRQWFVDDFNRKALSLEVMDSTYRKFRAYAIGSTAETISKFALPHKCTADIAVDQDTDKSFIVDIVKEKKPQKKPNAQSYDYKAMRKAAEGKMLPVVSNGPVKCRAVIRDDGLTDFFSSAFAFLPLTLPDGQEIYAEIRSRTKKSEDAINIEEKMGSRNQLTERKNMFPGVNVTCCFTPDQKKTKMILRYLRIDDEDISIPKLEYFRTALIRKGLLPKSEEKVNIKRMDEEERERYIEILKNIEHRGKSSY